MLNATKRIWTMIGAALVGAVLALTLAACDGSGSYSLEDRLDRARQARAEGDVRAAILELKNALRDHPTASAARFFLGQLYLEMDDGNSAEKELELAARYGIAADAVMLPLAQAWNLQHEYEKVLRDVPISINMPPRTQSALRVIHGDAYYGLGRMREAESSYEAAIAADSSNALAHVGLGSVALISRNYDEALARLALAQNIDANDSKVITLEGDIAAARGEFKEALKSYSRLVQLRPHNLLYQTVLAWAQFNSGDSKAATRTIQNVLKNVPDYPPANHIWSVIAYTDQKFQDAADAAQRVLSVAPDRIPSYLILGAASYSLGRMEQAHAALTRYVAARPNDHEAAKLLGNIQMILGRSSDAYETLSGIVDDETTDAELLDLVAQAALQKGDLVVGRKYLERSLSAERDASTVGRLGLAELALGNVEQGLKELERAVELDPKSFERRMVLALQYLRTGRNAEGLELAREMQKLNPKRAAGFTIEGLGLAQNGDLEAATAAFHKALNAEPGNPNAAHSLARIAASRQQWDDVEKVLKEVLKHHPEERTTLLLLADLAERRDDRREQIKLLQRAVQAHPEAREPAIFLARALLMSGQPGRAVDAIGKVRPLFPTDPALLELAGQAEMAAGQAESAIITYEQLVAARPDSPIALYQLGSAFEAQGNHVRAADAYGRAHELEPGDATIKLALARSKLQLGQADDAMRLADELLADASGAVSTVAVYHLRGNAALAKKDSEEAVKAFAAAYDLQKNSANLRLLSEAQALAGQPAVAVATLNAWLKEYPKDSDTRFQLATVHLMSGDLERAAQEYETILADHKDSAVVLNNLAWTSNQMGQSDKALQQIRRALSIRSDVADFHHTAGGIYMTLKRYREAVDAYRRAVDLAPEDAEVRERYAEALIAADRRADAAEVLDELLRGPYNLPDRPKVERLLLQLTAE